MKLNKKYNIDGRWKEKKESPTMSNDAHAVIETIKKFFMANLFLFKKTGTPIDKSLINLLLNLVVCTIKYDQTKAKI